MNCLIFEMEIMCIIMAGNASKFVDFKYFKQKIINAAGFLLRLFLYAILNNRRIIPKKNPPGIIPQWILCGDERIRTAVQTSKQIAFSMLIRRFAFQGGTVTAYRTPTPTVNLETQSFGRMTILRMHLGVNKARIAEPTLVQKSCADNGPSAALAKMD